MPSIHPTLEDDKALYLPDPLVSANVNYRAIIKHKLSGSKALNLKQFEQDLKKIVKKEPSQKSTRVEEKEKSVVVGEENKLVKIVHKRGLSHNLQVNKQQVFSKFNVGDVENLVSQAKSRN